MTRAQRQALMQEKLAANSARLRATGKVKNMPGYRLSGIGKNRRWRAINPTDDAAWAAAKRSYWKRMTGSSTSSYL